MFLLIRIRYEAVAFQLQQEKQNYSQRYFARCQDPCRGDNVVQFIENL